MICISVRPNRASHNLIEKSGDFVVNIPWPEMEFISDFVGSTTIVEKNKWKELAITHLVV